MHRALYNSSQVWKPLYEYPCMIWWLLSFDTSHWLIVVPPWKPLLDFDRGLGGRVLVLLSTECWVAHYHSDNTWSPMVWYITTHDVTLDVVILALPDEPVTSQVHSDRFDCEQSNAIIILFIQLGGGTIFLCLHRTVIFLSSQWQYILARSIRFLFSWTHGYPKTYQCKKSFAVASLMTSCKLCLYATP